MTAASAPPFRLPASALREVRVMESWITNGHWALRRSAIANLPTLDGPVASDAVLRRCLPQRVRPWHATGHVLVVPPGHGTSRELRVGVFMNEAGTQRVAFDVRYLALLKLARLPATLYGTGPGEPFRNAARVREATAVLMPVRL